MPALRANNRTQNSGDYGVHARWGYYGTCREVGEKHPGCWYADEFSGQHNHYPKDASDQMVILAKRMVSKRLTYKELVA